jgi:hypothetical protein
MAEHKTKDKKNTTQAEYTGIPRSHRDVNEYSDVLRREPECDNPYAAFAPKPKHVHFESQDPGERVILFVRRHPITNVPWMLTTIILAVLPVFLDVVPILDFFPERFQFMTLLGWYVFILGFVLENFLSWFFNVNIFTDERVIDIDFYSLIYKRITSAQIDKVEDVTSSVGGFLGSVLDYGNVDIQTAAQERELSFELVPEPGKISQVLNELILEEEHERLEGRVR